MSYLLLGRPTLPAALVLVAIAGVLLLALVPNTGAIPASSTCAYGSCPSTSTTSTPLALYALLGVLVLVAAVLGVMLFLRRRSRAAPSGAVEPWSGPAPGAPGGEEMGGEPPLMPAPGAAPPAAALAPAYLESPEDVGVSPPETPEAAPPPADAGGDIDSLMKELDKISGEILQRGKPKTPPSDGADEGEQGSGQ